MSEQRNTTEKGPESIPQEKEKGAESTAEKTKRLIRKRVAESVEKGKQWLREKFLDLTEEEAEQINVVTKVSETQATRAGEEANKRINEVGGIDETAEPQTKKFTEGEEVMIKTDDGNFEGGYKVLREDEEYAYVHNEITGENSVFPLKKVISGTQISEGDIGEQWKEASDSTIEAEPEFLAGVETEEQTTELPGKAEEGSATEKEPTKQRLVKITGVGEDDIIQLTAVLEVLSGLDWDATHEIVKQIAKGGTYTLKLSAEKNVEDTIDYLETNGATAEKVEPTEAKSETGKPSEEAEIFQQAKLEARFGKENAEKLKAEHILENENYKKAIDEIVATLLLSPGKETRQTEANIIKKMTAAFGDYFSETPEEQKQGACWEIFNAIKSHIAYEAAKTEPKSLKRKLAKGAMYWGAGLGGTLTLGPLGGILIAGGLRQVDTAVSHLASKKRLREHKETINTDETGEGKRQLGATITDLILAKKKTELLKKKHGEGETWKDDTYQLEFAERYYKNALEYLKAHRVEEIEGLSDDEISTKAEIIATYFAIDDKTEKMLKELDSTQDGKENTKWKSLTNVFRKFDNTPSKKFYSAATATGIGLGIRGAVTTMGMSSKWVRRTMMAFAGYKIGGAIGEMAAGKKSPEAITKKSLESLKGINLEKTNDQTILDNYLKEISMAKIAISEIPETAKNKSQIEKWKRELESREFELLNETIIKKTENEFSDEVLDTILGLDETEAKEELSKASSRAKAWKIGGRIGGVILGLAASEVSGIIMQKVSERMQGDKAAGGAKSGQEAEIEIEPKASTPQEIPEKYKVITKKNLFAELGEEQPTTPAGAAEEAPEFLKPGERIGSEQPRPVPTFEHEIGKPEMPTGDYNYKGGDNIWEESENQLKAVLGDKFEGLSVEERNILIDDVKDSIVEDIGQPENNGYYNKMTENDLKEIDWEKHVRGTIKTARPQGLITPEIQHPDITEPTAPPTEGPHGDLIHETEITQSDELLKPKKGFSSILEKATSQKPKETDGLSESLHEIKSGGVGEESIIDAEATASTDEAMPANLETPEPAGEPVNVSKVRADVEKTVVESIKTKDGTQKLATVIKQESTIDKKLKKAGIDFNKWEKWPPKKLSVKLSELTKPQQKLYKTKTFITIAKETIAKLTIEK